MISPQMPQSPSGTARCEFFYSKEINTIPKCDISRLLFPIPKKNRKPEDEKFAAITEESSISNSDELNLI
jgi:hypothetical protein